MTPRPLIFSFLIFLSLLCRAQIKDDSAKSLEKRLDAYVAAIEAEPTAVKQQECDFLISSCQDEKVRNHVAGYLYSRYLNSKVMGDEAVAIYITDNWFIPGKASLPSPDDLMLARVFADFNRSSQIGSKAPSLLLESPGGSKNLIDFTGASLKVLYIYDTGCKQCSAESALLSTVLPSSGHTLELIALYSGTDREAWLSYCHKNLPLGENSLKVSHYWDPSLESGFQKKYGVLSTPRMFLIGQDGVILGRNLTTESLVELLDALDSPYPYGSAESMDILEGIFSGQDAATTISTIKYLSQQGAMRDSTMWRHVTGDLLYFFNGRRGEVAHKALSYVADSLVLRSRGAWRGSDTLSVLSLAGFISDLAALSPVGSAIAPLKLPGTLIKGRREKNVSLRLDKIKGQPSVIVFYTPSCEHCTNAVSAIREQLSAPENKKMAAFLVNLDALSSGQKAEVAEKFDLSVLPFIIETDRKGRISRKYLSY